MWWSFVGDSTNTKPPFNLLFRNTALRVKRYPYSGPHTSLGTHSDVPLLYKDYDFSFRSKVVRSVAPILLAFASQVTVNK